MTAGPILAALAGLLGFGWLTVFQLLLAAGAPLGRLAWGGQARVLPAGLRRASLAAAGVAAVGWLAVAQTVGLIAGPLPVWALRPLLLVLCGLFALSALANMFGARGAERLHGVPLAVVLAGSTAALAPVF